MKLLHANFAIRTQKFRRGFCALVLFISIGLMVIKVSDFGLTEDMSDSNYYHYHSRGDTAGTGEKVPIRWMAPESIETHVY